NRFQAQAPEQPRSISHVTDRSQQFRKSTTDPITPITSTRRCWGRTANTGGFDFKSGHCPGHQNLILAKKGAVESLVKGLSSPKGWCGFGNYDCARAPTTS